MDRAHRHPPRGKTEPAKAQDCVRYSDDVETILPGESDTIEQILASMLRLHGRNHEEQGDAVRVSHAKSRGVAVGELTVLDNLPEVFAQGLFVPGALAEPASVAEIPA